MNLTPQDVWMLASTALVLVMTPGLALFYGGLVRVRSVVNMMLFSLSAMGLVGVLWILFGYSMNYFAAGESGFAGSPFKTSDSSTPTRAVSSQSASVQSSR